MRIMICQLDGILMNVALGKLATYHHLKGDNVSFSEPEPDRIYYGAIYSKTVEKFKFQNSFPGITLVKGGYYFNRKLDLPSKIEFLMPYYALWDVDYSIGYTSRGCIRKCPFCIVPTKEGRIRDHQFIADFHHKDHNQIILLDNNFFASPNWRSNISYINELGLKVNFNQGLDLRILTEEMANILADTRSYTHRFDGKGYFFAFDDIKDEEKIRKGLDLLLSSGINPNIIFVYVLSGFNSTFEDDLYRCQLLWHEYHVHPYLMRIDGSRSNKKLNALARWANRPALHRNHTFTQYCEYMGVR